MTSELPQNTTKIFDDQLAYTLGRAENDGSPAIALGRTAGLAKILGLEKTAAHFWNQLGQLPPQTKPAEAMPGLDDLYSAYKNNPAAFSRFANKGEFPAPGTDFSNAAGSYAFALDYMRRGEAAIANGGEPFRIYDAGAGALHAAGFEQQAAKLDALSAEARQAPKKWVEATKQPLQGRAL